jgi:hypothetical protein
MAMTGRSNGTSSRPEDKKLTQELERRFKEQEDAKRAGRPNPSGFKVRTSNLRQP